MKIWVITAKSESGDKYGPIAFSKKPSPSLLKKIVHNWDGFYTYSGDQAGPGDYGSFVYLDIDKVEIDAEIDYLNKLEEPKMGEQDE